MQGLGLRKAKISKRKELQEGFTGNLARITWITSAGILGCIMVSDWFSNAASLVLSILLGRGYLLLDDSCCNLREEIQDKTTLAACEKEISSLNFTKYSHWVNIFFNMFISTPHSNPLSLHQKEIVWYKKYELIFNILTIYY